jgi:hypothetical protein
MKKLSGIHGTVEGVIKDLQASGWITVEQPELGDVLVWEALKFKDGLKQHIGFSLGNGRAVSTSVTKKTPIEHDAYFGETHRKIAHVFRMPSWDE